MTEETGSIRKVVGASFIGTTIEWYDYFIYSTAATLVFPQLFFPDFSPFAGTLAPVGGTVPISVYVAAVCALSVVCYLLAPETYQKDIYAEDAAERSLVAEQNA